MNNASAGREDTMVMTESGIALHASSTGRPVGSDASVPRDEYPKTTGEHREEGEEGPVRTPTVKRLFEDRSEAGVLVPVEEPLEIFVDGKPFYVTMRLPGEEIALAVGLCFTEGVIESVDDLSGAAYCGDLSANRVNIFRVRKNGRSGTSRVKRKKHVTSSSCGICGGEMIADICRRLRVMEARTGTTLPFLKRLHNSLEKKQDVYGVAGGTHAAAIFDDAGETLSFAEDVGRHNALDKAIGRLLLTRETRKASIVLLSSRLSFDMVQKAARVGAEIVGGSSCATSLAVDLAKRINMTLIGDLRSTPGTVYCRAERIGADLSRNG